MSETPAWLGKVEAVVEEITSREGIILYDMEFVGVGKGRTLRIFIDRADGNVTIDDCSTVSKALNAILDEQDLIPGDAYNLEVSTPGLERHLKKQWHFEKAVGKKIYIKTSKPLESLGVTDKKWKNTKTVEEVLDAADGMGLRFVVGEVTLEIPYALIDKAKVVFEMNKAPKK